MSRKNMKKSESEVFFSRLESFLLSKGMTINSLEVAVKKNTTLNKAKNENRLPSNSTIKAILDYFPELEMNDLLPNKGNYKKIQENENNEFVNEDHSPEYLTGNILVRGRLIDMVESQQKTIETLTKMLSYYLTK